MKKTGIKGKVFLSILFISTNIFGLVPLESLILGDFSKNYVEEKSDPLNYIFRYLDKDLSTVNPDTDKNYYLKQDLALYRGFYEEGENLENFCKRKPEVSYATVWDKKRVTRSVMATLQYIGLDLTLRALPKYAKFFEYSEQDYKNLGDNLIGNYCSKNLTILSLRQLRNLFMIKFTKENSFELPSIKNNPLFAPKLKRLAAEDEVKKREFYWTIELFKSFCSWGGEEDNSRLLVPLLRHPGIMAFINRQMANQKITWEPFENKVYIEEFPTTTQVYCDNLICRKFDKEKFLNTFPKSVGTSSLKNDLDRVYCSEMRDIDYKTKDQVPKILSIIKQMSFDEQNLLRSQFVSLLTGYPDFMIPMENFSTGKEMVGQSYTHSWNEWADAENAKLDKNLYFEETLTVEKVDRSIFFNRFKPNFEINLDINLGELDSTNQKVGKLTSTFHLPLSKKFLVWALRNWKGKDLSDRETVENVFKPFRVMIADNIERNWKKLKLPEVKGDLENLIMREILAQISLYQGRFFRDETGIVKIPVKVNFGAFALKYLRFQYYVKQNEGEREKKLARLRSLRN